MMSAAGCSKLSSNTDEGIREAWGFFRHVGNKDTGDNVRILTTVEISNISQR